MHTQNIFLIGLMGSGKSTVGRVLANKLDKTFMDSDDETVKRNGVAIQTIFEIEGEEGFRDREQAVISDLCEQKNIVLATGGGAILRVANRQSLAEHGMVVYLEASAETLYQRTKHDTKRPLLQQDNPRAILANLYRKRDPLYRALADKIIFTNNSSSSYATVKQIMAYLETL